MPPATKLSPPLSIEEITATDVPGGRTGRSTEPQRDMMSESPFGTDGVADDDDTASAEEYD